MPLKWNTWTQYYKNSTGGNMAKQIKSPIEWKKDKFMHQSLYTLWCVLKKCCCTSPVHTLSYVNLNILGKLTDALKRQNNRGIENINYQKAKKVFSILFSLHLMRKQAVDRKKTLSKDKEEPLTCRCVWGRQDIYTSLPLIHKLHN